MININNLSYEVVENFREGFNEEAFRARFSEILTKYDYIVGDWGYGQLRLRGFYENSNRKVPFDQKIAALDEYLQEFCNFGCPYFVLKKVKASISSDPMPEPQGEPNEEVVPYTEKRDRSQRHFSPRHERFDRERSLGEKQARGEKPEKTGRNMRSEHQQRQEKGFKERRGGQNFRPHRDKVPASGVGAQKGAKEKRD
jgi:uncharacterized protein YutD